MQVVQMEKEKVMRSRAEKDTVFRVRTVGRAAVVMNVHKMKKQRSITAMNKMKMQYMLILGVKVSSR
jgi:hypothetical protein